MAPRTRKIQLKVSDKKSCMFCGRNEISETLYGQLYQLKNVVVHYYCLLLSSNVIQRGSDKDGIWGFLLKDIEAELNRDSRVNCVYCLQPGANISCCGSKKKCRKIFHLPCGLENGSMHQYFGEFKSFCQKHRIKQTIDPEYSQNSTSVQCTICLDVLRTNLPTTLWAPCCKRNGWFHRKCIQELAISTGYFFKCPLCNNIDEFKSGMLTLGIYVPSRDASWETEPNAYAELLERHSMCNAEPCGCTHQAERNFQEEEGIWEIIICNTCGSSGTHRYCSSLECNQQWTCKSCSVITDPKRRRIETSNGNSSTSSSVSRRVEMTNENSTTSSISRRVEMINDNSTTHESQPSNRNISQ